MEIGEVVEFVRQTCRRRRGGSTRAVLYVECRALVVDDFLLQFGEARERQFVLRFREWRQFDRVKGLSAALLGLVPADLQ